MNWEARQLLHQQQKLGCHSPLKDSPVSGSCTSVTGNSCYNPAMEVMLICEKSLTRRFKGIGTFIQTRVARIWQQALLLTIAWAVYSTHQHLLQTSKLPGKFDIKEVVSAHVYVGSARRGQRSSLLFETESLTGT